MANGLGKRRQVLPEKKIYSTTRDLFIDRIMNKQDNGEKAKKKKNEDRYPARLHHFLGDPLTGKVEQYPNNYELANIPLY